MSNIDFNLSNEEYHSKSDVLSASGCKTIIGKTLSQFKYAKRTENPAFAVGTAFHSMCLEPDTVKETVMVGGDNRRGKAWAEAKAEADKRGAVLLTTEEYELCCNMTEATFANKQAASLLNSEMLIAEASIFSTDPDTGVKMRCRPDGWLKQKDNTPSIVIDLKSTIDAGEGFARQVVNYGYHYQESFYRKCMAQAGVPIDKFYFIAVCKTYPHDVGIYLLSEDTINEGDAGVRYGLEKFAMAQETGNWTSGHEEAQVIDIPRWGYKFSNPAIEF